MAFFDIFKKKQGLFWAALVLAGLQLFPNLQQLLIVIFSHPGRVDTYPDMTETFIFVEHGLDFPGIDKSGKVVIHIKGNTPDLRVAFQKRSQRHMGSRCV